MRAAEGEFGCAPGARSGSDGGDQEAETRPKQGFPRLSTRARTSRPRTSSPAGVVTARGAACRRVRHLQGFRGRRSIVVTARIDAFGVVRWKSVGYSEPTPPSQPSPVAACTCGSGRHPHTFQSEALDPTDEMLQIKGMPQLANQEHAASRTRVLWQSLGDVVGLSFISKASERERA